MQQAAFTQHSILELHSIFTYLYIIYQRLCSLKQTSSTILKDFISTALQYPTFSENCRFLSKFFIMGELINCPGCGEVTSDSIPRSECLTCVASVSPSQQPPPSSPNLTTPSPPPAAAAALPSIGLHCRVCHFCRRRRRAALWRHLKTDLEARLDRSPTTTPASSAQPPTSENKNKTNDSGSANIRDVPDSETAGTR